MELPRKEKLWWIASLGALAGLEIATFILPGGDDLYRYYQPFARGCLDCGFVPYFAQWFLWPLLLPYPYTWPVWTLLSGAGFLLIARHTKVNPLLFLIALPMASQVWGGQIDIIIVAGLLLALKSRNPYLRGLGMVMALVKPQLSIIPLFFLLLQEKRQEFWKVLLVPFLVGLLSLLVYGMDWPITWIHNALYLPDHPRRLASEEIWRWGIFLVWVPLLFRENKSRFIVSLLIGSIATPFFSIYSYVIFLAFYLPSWAIPVSYSWLLFIPFFGEEASRFAWILPLSLLFYMTITEIHKRRQPPIADKGSSHA